MQSGQNWPPNFPVVAIDRWPQCAGFYIMAVCNETLNRLNRLPFYPGGQSGRFFMLLTLQVHVYACCSRIMSASLVPCNAGSFRWVLPYQDPCVCTAVRLGGHLPYKPATGHYLEGLFLSEDSDEIRKFFECSSILTDNIAVTEGKKTYWVIDVLVK